MKKIFLVLGSVGVSLLVGCATSGKVTPKHPLNVNLSTYPVYYVEVKASNPALQKFIEPLKLTTSSHLESKLGKKIEKRAATSTSGALVELTVNGYEQGSSALRFFNLGGETKIVAVGRIYDLATKKVVHTFELEGTSLRESQTSIGAGGLTIFNTKWVSVFDENTQRALDSAGTYLAKYVVGEK